MNTYNKYRSTAICIIRCGLYFFEEAGSYDIHGQWSDIMAQTTGNA